MSETIRKVSNNWKTICFSLKILFSVKITREISWETRVLSLCTRKVRKVPFGNLNESTFINWMCDEYKISLFCMETKINPACKYLMCTSGQATVLVVVVVAFGIVQYLCCVSKSYERHTHSGDEHGHILRLCVCVRAQNQSIVAIAFEFHNQNLCWLIDYAFQTILLFSFFCVALIRSFIQWFNQTLDLQVKEYKDGLIKKAETLITIGFPEKIVRLNELLETEMFANRNLHDVHQASNASI